MNLVGCGCRLAHMGDIFQYWVTNEACLHRGLESAYQMCSYGTQMLHVWNIYVH